MHLRTVAGLLAAGVIMGTGMTSVRAESAVEPVKDLVFDQAEAVGQGWKFTLDLGTRRVNWNNARWSVARWDAAPRDWSGVKALRLEVLCDPPRTGNDAGVYLAVQEAGGAWYCHPWASRLNEKVNRGEARLEDFMPAEHVEPPPVLDAGRQPAHAFGPDDNGRLDSDKIIALAVGCVNPLGVGQVRFTLSRLEMVTGGGPRPQEQPLAIQVTGKPLDINGTTTIPAGLFGGYNLRNNAQQRYRLAMDRALVGVVGGGPRFGDGTVNMFINTPGERMATSVRLNLPDWEPRSRDTGRAYAAAAKAAGKVVYVEYWNEPYLNWANKNRKNFDPAHYNLDQAGEGATVRIKHDGAEVPHLKWTRNPEAPPWLWMQRYSPDGRDNWRRGKDATGRVYSTYAEPYNNRRKAYNPALHPPGDVADGQTYKVADAKGTQIELTAFTPWHIYDETQFTYWSATGMVKLYLDPLLAFARGLKEQHKDHSVLIAGWGFRASEDHWDAWRLSYQPVIDAAIEYLDGVCDHDYGADPLKMAANYEFVTAYGVTRHRKWLHSYNTETAAMSDPQAMPGLDQDAKASAADARKFHWTVRKLMHSLAHCPDKARSFAWFGYGGGWFSETGEGVALASLINLRGRLVQVVQNSDPQVYVVAAVDGTDPANPRPAELGADRRELVVALFNDALTPRTIALSLAAPAGMKFSGVGSILTADTAAGAPLAKTAAREVAAGAGPVELSQVVAPRQLVVVTLPVTGELARGPLAAQRQFFAGKLLAQVGPGAPWADTIAVDAAVLKRGVRRAWLSLGVEYLTGGGTATLNGQAVPLPRTVTQDNSPRLVRVPVPASLVTARNELRIESAGFRLASASLLVETDAE